MTIIAGFRCYDGVVVCADTQETILPSKRNVSKLRYEPSRVLARRMLEAGSDLAAAFCGAGDGPFIDKLVNESWQAAQVATSLDEACSEIEKQIKHQYEEFGRIYQVGYVPEVQLIFGVKMGGESRLFSASGPIVNERDGYDAAGIGRYMADFLAGRMYKDHLNVKQCFILAAYILFQAKEHVDGCGGDSQIAVLRNDASSGLVDWKRVEVITNMLKAADREMGDILLQSADLDIEDKEFREGVEVIASFLESCRLNHKDDLKRWDMFTFLGGERQPKDELGLPTPSGKKSKPEQ